MSFVIEISFLIMIPKRSSVENLAYVSPMCWNPSLLDLNLNSAKIKVSLLYLGDAEEEACSIRYEHTLYWFSF